MIPNLIFSALVTAFFGVVFLALGYESWALLTGHEPITTYVRAAVHAYPGWAFAAAIVLGGMLGHFLWGPRTGPCSPEAR
ncbi:MAG TPA: hypothetical protein VK131_02300 [Candidatus Acidoferrales bacterium]|nr:hypothetical protein [Candidatus Acidoferrales bacterium]